MPQSVPPRHSPMSGFRAPVPEGMIRTAHGKNIPIASAQARHVLEDQLVRDLVAKAEVLRAAILAFKAGCMSDIDTYRGLMADRFNVTLAGRRGGLSMRSYDDTLRVQVSESDSMSFGPELEVAKTLIDECLDEWSEGGNSNLRTIVLDAFNVGETGRIRMDRVLSLKRYQIDDDRWRRAMVAISEAVRPERSKSYVRLYRRATPDEDFHQIVLDVSRA